MWQYTAGCVLVIYRPHKNLCVAQKQATTNTPWAWVVKYLPELLVNVYLCVCVCVCVCVSVCVCVAGTPGQQLAISQLTLTRVTRLDSGYQAYLYSMPSDGITWSAPILCLCWCLGSLSKVNICTMVEIRSFSGCATMLGYMLLLNSHWSSGFHEAVL